MTTVRTPLEHDATYRRRTTDATVTTVQAERLPHYGVCRYEVVATALNNAGTISASFVRHASFRWAAGVLAKVGQTLDTVTIRDSGAAIWDVGVSASTPDALVQIVGQAATTINWHIKVTAFANISKSDSGTSTATSATTLTDNTKAWIVDEWAGGFVDGGGVGRMRIVSNTATVLTGVWTGVTPPAVSAYVLDLEPMA